MTWMPCCVVCVVRMGSLSTHLTLSCSLLSAQRGDLEGARRLIKELRALDLQIEDFEVKHYGKAAAGAAGPKA